MYGCGMMKKVKSISDIINLSQLLSLSISYININIKIKAESHHDPIFSNISMLDSIFSFFSNSDMMYRLLACMDHIEELVSRFINFLS